MMSPKSCLYQGTVTHRRRSPVHHTVRYGIWLLYVDIDVSDPHFESNSYDMKWLWSERRWVLVGLCRADFPGNPQEALRTSIETQIREAGYPPPGGPIRLLTQPRILGFVFNPISLFYCFDLEERLQFVVADVRNIPWGESHVYVLSPEHWNRTGSQQPIPKALHVSPFLPMDMTYIWHIEEPGDALRVEIDVVREGARVLDAKLSLKRGELSRWSLAIFLLRQPWASYSIPIKIYWEAAKLWWKRSPFFQHPRYLGEISSPAKLNTNEQGALER